MTIAISLDPFKFVRECDRKLPPPERTWFLLRRLSARENAQIEDSVRASIKIADVMVERMNAAVGMQGSPGTIVVETMRIGLLDWGNLFDAKGKAVKFIAAPTEGPYANLCPYKNMDLLDADCRHDIAEGIDQGDEFTEEDSKNLPSEPIS